MTIYFGYFLKCLEISVVNISHRIIFVCQGSTAVGAFDKKQIFSQAIPNGSASAGFAALGMLLFIVDL